MNADEFWHHIDRSGGPAACWPWPPRSTTEHGYGVVRFEGAARKAHRVAAKLSGMEIEGVHVLHTCDNPPCCNPAHFFLGTPADNAADRERKGRGHYGSRTGTSKLTEAQVAEIRRRRAAGEQGKRLAAEFGVSPMTISYITVRGGWAHVKEGET